jgi:hypothetical protein
MLYLKEMNSLEDTFDSLFKQMGDGHINKKSLISSVSPVRLHEYSTENEFQYEFTKHLLKNIEKFMIMEFQVS